MIGRSLVFRLVAWYCGLLLVLGAGFAGYTALGFTRYVDASSRRTLLDRADELWILARPLIGDPAALAAAIERRFAPEAQDRFIRLSLDGRLLYRSGPPAGGGFDPAALPPVASLGALVRVPGLHVVARRFALPDGRTVLIESGHPDTVLREAQRGLETSLLVALPLFLVIAAAGGWVLVRRALAPVRAMIEAAEALSFNSPDKRLPLRGTLEPITALGQSLNRLLERLDNAYQHVARFSAEAAHELRTPLTIIHGEIELIQSTAELPEPLHQALAAALQEITRLGRIVEGLITLSRMDSIWGKQAHLAVDLQALAGETVEQMRLLAEDKAVALDCTPSPALTVMGDRNRLKQVLVNLIDNAVKFTPAGGRIAVSLATSQGWAVLAVEDDGIGIAPEHQERIFERSYRVNGGEPGAGLGLAIARSICAAHGGRIELTSTPGRGSSFRIVLPRGTA